MDIDHEAKGKQLMSDAEQKMNVTTCRSPTRAKIEEACELYVKAAYSFKMGKNWTLAGNAFREAAAKELSSHKLHDAGAHYDEASKCYKKENIGESIQCLLKAIEIYTDMGRHRFAAKDHQSLADLYESGECCDISKAIEHYTIAADLFRGDESTSSANKCLLSAAKNSALNEDFNRAIEIYETVVKSALDSVLLKYTANDLFLRAALCHMCVHPQGAISMVDSYVEMSPAFKCSREYTLSHSMAQNVTEKDIEGFNEAIKNHESVSLFDQWHNDIIEKIRKQIDGTPDLR